MFAHQGSGEGRQKGPSNWVLKSVWVSAVPRGWEGVPGCGPDWSKGPGMRLSRVGSPEIPEATVSALRATPMSPQPPCSLQSVFPLVAEGQRSARSQAMYQLFGLFVTLMFASVGGSLGGK